MSDAHADVLMSLSDESLRHFEMGADWLTVAQTAALLGLSSRAVQRRCKTGQLVARLVADKGGQHWQIGARPDGKPLEAATLATPATVANDGNDAPNDTRDSGNDGQTTPYEGNDATPATLATEQTTGATVGTTPSTEAHDALTSRYVAHLESEVAHLRGQIEAHARAEAELRAALREALKLSSRALPAPGEDSVTNRGDGADLEQLGTQKREKLGQVGTETTDAELAQISLNGAQIDPTAPTSSEPIIEAQRAAQPGFLRRVKVFLIGGEL